MARSGSTSFEPNEAFFESVLRRPQVEAIVDTAAAAVQSAAQASAPVNSGDYRDGIVVEHKDSRYRRVARVVGTDDKTMLIESKTGNLARAVKATKT